MLKNFLISFFVSIFFLSYFTLSDSFGYGNHSLRGISGVAVFVENHSNHLSDRQIYLEQLQETLHEKIDVSEVDVYKRSQWMNRAGGGFIKIRIISSENADRESYTFYLNFEFYRPVTLMANILGQSKLSTAATWSTGKLMSCPKKNIPSCIYKNSSELADIFIEEYLAVNEIKFDIDKKKKKKKDN